MKQNNDSGSVPSRTAAGHKTFVGRLLLMTLLMFTFIGGARATKVEIGDLENAGNNSYLPMNSLYKYSYTQQIYTAEEIGMAGTINSITVWLYGNENLYEMPFDIYMVETDKVSFDSNTDWVSVTTADIVYSGTVTVHNTEAEAYTFTLDTPFNYSGTGNLVICFNNTTGEWKSGLRGMVFTAEDSVIRSIYVYQDGAAYDPTNISSVTANARTAQRDVIEIDITPGSGPTCDKPETLQASNETTTGVTLTWTSGSGTYNVEYKKASDTDWTSFDTGITALTIDLTNLTPGTSYQARVQSVCDGNTSGWKTVNFSTECGAITTFPWSEDFESYASGDFSHLCWVNEHISGEETYIFKISTSGMGDNSTKKLQLPDMKAGTMTKLVLPEMTLNDNYQFVLDVYRGNSTYNDQYASEGIRVFVSADGEIENATEIGFIPRQYNVSSSIIPAEAEFGWYTYELPIPMTGTCYIVLRGESQYCTATYMDNFVVELAPSCLKPTGLTNSDVTAHEATITWVSDAEAWEIQLNDEEPIAVTKATYTFEGLNPMTTYSVKVRTNCGANGYSDWINRSFTTTIACPVPSGLTATLTPGDGSVATLSWTELGDATEWVVAYKTADNENFTEINNVTENPYTLTNLTPETAYTAKVKAVCGGEDGESQWSSTITFTPTDTYALTVNDGTTTNNYVPVYGTWVDSYTKCQFIIPANKLESILYDNINKMTFYSSTANKTFGAAEFDILLTEVNNTTFESSTLVGWNDMQVVYHGAVSISNNKMEIVFDNDYQYMGGNLLVGFHQTVAGTYGNISWYGITSTNSAIGGYENNAKSLVVQNFLPKTTFNYEPGEPPSCPKPSGLTVSNITAHEADLTWTENGDATTWIVELDTDADFETVSSVTVQNEPSFHFQSLYSETTYYVRVKAVCAPGEESDYSKTSFTTPIACPAPTGLATSNISGHEATLNWTGNSDSYDVSYRKKLPLEGLFEYFTGLNGSSPPSGWKRSQELLTNDVLNGSTELGETTAGYGWAFGTANVVFDAHAYLTIENTYTKNWLISPSIEVAADYVFDFDLALTQRAGTLQPVIAGSQADDKFVVLISTDETEGWTILRQWDNAGSEYVYDNITCSATGEHVSFDLSDYIGQNVQIAFYGESTVAGGRNYLHIDNVIVGIPDEWQKVSTIESTYILTGLTPETDYEVKVESSCEGEQGHETGIVTFTTDVAYPTPTGLTATTIAPTSIELSWTENGEATAWQIQVGEEDPINVVDNPYTLESLSPDTEYTIKVRADGGEDGHSEWSSTITVTTLPSNPVPTDLTVNEVTATTATISWTGYSDSYNVYLGKDNITEVCNTGFEDEVIPTDWGTTNDEDNYPWTVTGDGESGYYMQSGNAGVASSTSTISATVTYPHNGTIEFDAQCMGEGIASLYDKCVFKIDGEEKFAKGENGSQWDHYSYEVAAGEHTFTWSYTKDGSVNKEGDHFAVDNVVMRSVNTVWNEDPVEVEYSVEYTFTGLNPETSYRVKVEAVLGENTSEASEVVAFTTTEVTDQINTYQLEAGENWVSFNIDISFDALKAALVSAYSGSNGIIINSQADGWAAYNDGQWRGALSALDLTQMYMIYVPAACEISLEGMPIDPAEHSVTICSTYNWIGFPLNQQMSLTNAFAGFAVAGDGIISKDHSANYNRGRWTGQLYELVPGQGYIYQSASSDDRTLVFPNSAKAVSGSRSNENGFGSHWPELNYHDFKLNSPLVATIQIEGQPVDNPSLEVAAFVNDECRGHAFLEYGYMEEYGDLYPVIEMPIYYTAPGEEVTFKLYDHVTGDVFDEYVYSPSTYIVTGDSYVEYIADNVLSLNFALAFDGLVLDNDATDNSERISAAAEAGGEINVKLAGRTLYKDGKWNTICLPFDVTLEDSPLAGAEAKTLSASKKPFDTVTLTFSNLEGNVPITVLKAGRPYIIRWEDNGDENIEDPVFYGVTIDATSRNITDDYVEFVGYYDALYLDPEHDTDDFAAAVVPYIYYLTADNKLKRAGQPRWLKACRAYFDFTALAPSGNGAREFILDFGDDEATGISEKGIVKEFAPATWYTVDGKKLDKQPTRKGVYIYNGDKVVIK